MKNEKSDPSEKFESIREDLKKIFEERPEVELAYLYGSVARGEANKLSDIDLAVYLEKGCDSGSVRMELVSEIASLIDDFDLVILNEARPLMAYNIVKDGIILFEESPTMKAEIESNIVRRYLDMKPYLLRHAEEMLNKFAEEGFA
ncbi:nucleotidyltransferase [Candidatus Haloredivivus sp. G17]|jgi:predicted nucleotidyltransferase|nr:nucleotidyltransferase [Candidatus Haloredivivus sp. G17]